MVTVAHSLTAFHFKEGRNYQRCDEESVFFVTGRTLREFAVRDLATKNSAAPHETLTAIQC